MRSGVETPVVLKSSPIFDGVDSLLRFGVVVVVVKCDSILPLLGAVVVELLASPPFSHGNVRVIVSATFYSHDMKPG